MSESVETEIPGAYRWLVAHRRLALAVSAGSAGFVSLVLGWWGVTNTVQVADQLTYIASGGLLGLFLLGIAGIAYWGEQREREVSHIIEMQLYLSAIAEALGLTETSQVSETNDGSATSADLLEQRPVRQKQRSVRPASVARASNGASSSSKRSSRTPQR